MAKARQRKLDLSCINLPTDKGELLCVDMAKRLQTALCEERGMRLQYVGPTPTGTHLVIVPVDECWWDLLPQCVFVHSELEVCTVMLHGDLVPVLVI